MGSGSANAAAGPLQARLSRIEQLLTSEPARAAAEAAELLSVTPDQPMAMLFRGIALRLTGDPAGAIGVLQPLCEKWPDAPLPQLQLGLALRETGQREAAAEAMRRAVAIRADFTDAWLALADLLITLGDRAAADRAFANYIRLSAHDRVLREPALAIGQNRFAEAETLLRKHLERHPRDVVALCMLADIAVRHARFDIAESLLRQCLDLAPSYRAARIQYAFALMRQGKPEEALREIDPLLALEPKDLALRALKANLLGRLREYEGAIGVYEELLAERPGDVMLWTSLGHMLRTVGRREACIGAYRKATSLSPQFGEAWWNLANLKTLQFDDAGLETMRTQLGRNDLSPDDRVHFHFAVGKALEDRREFAESFRHYAEGNRLRRQSLRYDPDDLTKYRGRCESLFTKEFFAARTGSGASDPDPIFIVGLPRTGSTLVEQILASHSAVEGTTELPHITGLVKELTDAAAGIGYPQLLAELPIGDLRALGASYVERTRVLRKRGTPFFIDKMPNNFAHIGLIHLILPNARIIDVRRHPLASGMSLFKHLFAQAQHFSYSFEDIGRYYRDYVGLMSHFDAVLPGRVHRVEYELLVEETEAEVRRLLEYCGLPFEASCLSFHKNLRPVATPSSEQVRTPIFRDGLDHWRNFETWLEPLKAHVGPLLG